MIFLHYRLQLGYSAQQLGELGTFRNSSILHWDKAIISNVTLWREEPSVRKTYDVSL